MSTQSIISLPPQLEMTPKSVSHLMSRASKCQSQNHVSEKERSVDKAPALASLETRNMPYANSLSVPENPSRSVIKLSENSFPVDANKAVNLRIMLHAASQMLSTRFRKVNL